MKKILSILLALALMLGATFALAEGNVTIAVQGMNDFNDYICLLYTSPSPRDS